MPASTAPTTAPADGPSVVGAIAIADDWDVELPRPPAVTGEDARPEAKNAPALRAAPRAGGVGGEAPRMPRAEKNAGTSTGAGAGSTIDCAGGITVGSAVGGAAVDG